jgi:hypothetical protein
VTQAPLYAALPSENLIRPVVSGDTDPTVLDTVFEKLGVGPNGEVQDGGVLHSVDKSVSENLEALSATTKSGNYSPMKPFMFLVYVVLAMLESIDLKKNAALSKERVGRVQDQLQQHFAPKDKKKTALRKALKFSLVQLVAFSQVAHLALLIGWVDDWTLLVGDESMYPHFGEEMRVVGIDAFIPRKPHPYGLIAHTAGTLTHFLKLPVMVAFQFKLPDRKETPTTAMYKIVVRVAHIAHKRPGFRALVIVLDSGFNAYALARNTDLWECYFVISLGAKAGHGLTELYKAMCCHLGRGHSRTYFRSWDGTIIHVSHQDNGPLAVYTNLFSPLKPQGAASQISSVRKTIPRELYKITVTTFDSKLALEDLKRLFNRPESTATDRRQLIIEFTGLDPLLPEPTNDFGLQLLSAAGIKKLTAPQLKELARFIPRCRVSGKVKKDELVEIVQRHAMEFTSDRTANAIIRACDPDSTSAQVNAAIKAIDAENGELFGKVCFEHCSLGEISDMLRCDSCRNYFHPECVAEQPCNKEICEYTCPQCAAKQPGSSTSSQQRRLRKRGTTEGAPTTPGNEKAARGEDGTKVTKVRDQPGADGKSEVATTSAVARKTRPKGGNTPSSQSQQKRNKEAAKGRRMSSEGDKHSLPNIHEQEGDAETTVQLPAQPSDAATLRLPQVNSRTGEQAGVCEHSECAKPRLLCTICKNRACLRSLAECQCGKVLHESCADEHFQTCKEHAIHMLKVLARDGAQVGHEEVLQTRRQLRANRLVDLRKAMKVLRSSGLQVDDIIGTYYRQRYGVIDRVNRLFFRVMNVMNFKDWEPVFVTGIIANIIVGAWALYNERCAARAAARNDNQLPASLEKMSLVEFVVHFGEQLLAFLTTRKAGK